jgi:serine/threonine protein phosphatase PrpC|tara:strand:- start:234 stop:617 length:384 start_codon:yes stop_codon:yes gene_type:complete
MGAYLDTPITEKETHDGEGLGLTYGLSAMQGWRSGMEDAHLARLGLSGGDDAARAAIFGVFDGHGGDLVAKEAALRLVAKLETAEGWSEFASGAATLDSGAVQALVRSTFLGLDEVSDFNYLIYDLV